MSSILRPGGDPPLLVPYCMVCDMPVEKFTFDVISSPWVLGISGHCCDRTQGARVPIEDVYRMKRTGEKFYLVVKSGRTQGLRGQARR